MIVIDSSAFVAIVADEPEKGAFSRAISRSPTRYMSAGTYLECAIVAGARFGGRSDLDDWLARRHVEVIPVDLGLARLAADAFARFGKGRHPAGLNYGDCFAYALAKARGAPLLFKGGDFGLTDLAPAIL